MLLRAKEGREGRVLRLHVLILLRTVLKAIPDKFIEYILADSQPNTASKHVTSLYREKISSTIIVIFNNNFLWK